MSRLVAVADRVAGQAFGLTNYDNLEADVNYLVIAGADLPSGATLDITSSFHGVTGTTTVDSISDALGAIAGQHVRLWIKNGPLSIRNNGGGAGNIRTRTGLDRTVVANEIVTLAYDGAVWREVTPGVGAKLDYAQITSSVNITHTTEGTADAVITGATQTYDTAPVLITFWCPWVTNTDKLLTYVLLRGATVLGQATNQGNFGSGAGNQEYQPNFLRFRDSAPPGGSYAYSLKAFTNTGTCVVGAGAGGSGTSMPAHLLVTKE